MIEANMPTAITPRGRVKEREKRAANGVIFKSCHSQGTNQVTKSLARAIDRRDSSGDKGPCARATLISVHMTNAVITGLSA
jgi:hypothetical protein